MRTFLCPCCSCLLALACASTPGGRSRGGPIPTVDQLAEESPPETCLLEKWEDGDTPLVRCSDGDRVPVRLIGIDTPESGFGLQSRRRGERQAKLWRLYADEIFACGKAATERAKELCPEGNNVQVIGNRTDKYQRRLAYVICEGINMNQVLLDEGLAGRFAYPADPEQPRNCPPLTAP